MTYARLADGPDAAIAAALAGDVAGIAVATSGSSGDPRIAHVGVAALRASASATHERLGGPGRWFLALPPDRIAGAQVIVRSTLAGHRPYRLAAERFESGAFARAAHAARDETPSGTPLYASLVPTQLARVLRDPLAATALDAFDAILVGGAALGSEKPRPNVVETYGSTETSGGCVYDGVPLPGVQVRLGADGRVEVAGPTLFDGYEDGEDDGTTTRDGVRWLRDAGRRRSLRADG